MRTWPVVFLLVLPIPAGCTSPAPERPAAPATSTHDAPVPETVGPEPPEPPFVAGRVVHTVDGERLRVRLGLRGRWSLTSVVPTGDGYLVTDDRWFEGTLGMHRIDARGRVLSAWASTGPALPGPRGGAAWVSLAVPESMEYGPTRIHAGGRVQDVGPLIMPVLETYDGEVVTFSARRPEGRRYVWRTFTTDLVGPPRRVSG
ncbi:MAG TPA: hypothetical protein VGV65_11315 [Nocardioides sp.]|nr:hypothetical protein [Nocardioides sp.]